MYSLHYLEYSFFVHTSQCLIRNCYYAFFPLYNFFYEANAIFILIKISEILKKIVYNNGTKESNKNEMFNKNGIKFVPVMFFKTKLH